LQEFFSRLSVFRGGWTAEAAEAVTGEKDVLDWLEYLRDYSLVLTSEVAGVIRFRFLETLREFAWEQLGEAEREQLSQHHADYFLGVFCPAAAAGLPDPDPRWLRRLEAEQENIRAALAWRAACCQESAGGGSTEADVARARALLEQLRLRQEAEKNTATGAAASSQKARAERQEAEGG
jgi:non-specific serine/threonine protein kinase